MASSLTTQFESRSEGKFFQMQFSNDKGRLEGPQHQDSGHIILDTEFGGLLRGAVPSYYPPNCTPSAMTKCVARGLILMVGW